MAIGHRRARHGRRRGGSYRRRPRRRPRACAGRLGAGLGDLARSEACRMGSHPTIMPRCGEGRGDCGEGGSPRRRDGRPQHAGPDPRPEIRVLSSRHWGLRIRGRGDVDNSHRPCVAAFLGGPAHSIGEDSAVIFGSLSSSLKAMTIATRVSGTVLAPASAVQLMPNAGLALTRMIRQRSPGVMYNGHRD